MFLAAVDAACVMRTVLSLWGGGNRRVVLGFATAARRKGAVEGKSVGLSTQRAEFGLERADASITFMPKAPAPVTLGNTSTAFGRSENKTMTAVHEGAADEVSEVETHAGVCNIEPDRAGVRVTCILGESRQGVLVIVEVLSERGDVEDLGDLIYHEGNQFACFLVAFKHQPVVGEVADLEA